MESKHNNKQVKASSQGFSEYLTQPTGLYSPAQERDACGVGFIANFKSTPSHELVRNALVMLARMDHRGGCGCEENTGDGAGVMVGIPHQFMVDVAATDLKIQLPEFESYAVGNVFLPKDEEQRQFWKSRLEFYITSRGLPVLGWREVPTDSSMIGPSAIRTEPCVEQLFVGPRPVEFTPKKFDLELYIAKQMLTKEAYAASAKTQSNPAVYICSLSCATMVYKGQLTAPQVPQYYLDLADPRFASHFALVHSRFSTNTFPSWDRAHPMRMLCHNGEINTLRGNKNMMFAREGVMSSPMAPDASFGPVCSDHYSDSGNLDACLELLSKASDRSLPEAVMSMIPEAWQLDIRLDEEKRAFYEYQSCAMEPWDGPAMLAFADGRYLGCTLDRNGLRPHRYYVTDDIVVAASEVGVIPDLDPNLIRERGRLMPGKMFLVDFVRQGIVRDEELKAEIALARPYRTWLRENLLRLGSSVRTDSQGRLPFLPKQEEVSSTARLAVYGYTVETMDILMAPMIDTGKEALGSMGTDTPIAILSTQPRVPYDYFQQLFAQVTNPPMDSIREEVVMSMECAIGPESNLLELNHKTCRRLILSNPILNPQEMEALVDLDRSGWKTVILDTTYDVSPNGESLRAALDRLCTESSNAIQLGATCVVLSDVKISAGKIPVPSLIALGAVHQHLIRNRERTKVAVVVESGDAREVHHHCLLIGFGADGVFPHGAYEAISHLLESGKLDMVESFQDAVYRYVKACSTGIKKVMGKIGISTIQSYKSAQIFECVGFGEGLMNRCFTGTASRLGGIDLESIHIDALRFHQQGFPSAPGKIPALGNPGEFHYRFGSEEHYNAPNVIVGIQRSSQDNDSERYLQYAKDANEQAKRTTLRGLFKFKSDPIPLNEVEPAREIVRRFVTGAMSFGSISKEAHESLAIAMNAIGGKSNTGEGGEMADRFSWRGPNGESKRSAIKQVASGRFGVTSNYLTNADEIQIKMAQGAKPGEGGELPGFKVFGDIPIVRKSTEGVGLISPPPHHDIYSIEDLAQLIYDLKNANRRARISVKLVSEVGVGVVAAGVAKAKADHITISGHDGGTGAAVWTGVKHAGLPWELGLAEAQQTLVLNGLRSRVVLQTDGQMKTGKDVAFAFLLGAEEVGFATAPLIALGCIMMRKCHLNTCPVGIATQDPELRAKFAGKPEHVINFMFMVAEEVRTYMAQMGFRTVREMVGRADFLEVDPEALKRNPKLKFLDLNLLSCDSEDLARNSPFSLLDPDLPVAMSNEQEQDHNLEEVLDTKMIALSRPALEKGEKVKVSLEVTNLDRSVGAMLSNEISRRYGESGLPDRTIEVMLKGYAGQSLGCFLARGVWITVEGDANDFVGKGLSGGTVVVYPFKQVKGKSEDSMIVGNVALYGATSGRAYFRGMAGERFCVRNSGAIVVVEGCGDHGCEYMTGGRAVILGRTGRNFGAGMSGGLAYVLDDDGLFRSRCNTELIDLEKINSDDENALRNDIADFVRFTGSQVGQRVLDNWSKDLFVKVYPKDLKRVIQGKPNMEMPFWFPSKSTNIKGGGGGGSHGGSGSSSGRGASPVKGRGFVKRKSPTSQKLMGDMDDVEDFGQTGCSTKYVPELPVQPLVQSPVLVMSPVAGMPTAKTAPIIVKKRDGKEGKLGKLRGFIEYERNAEAYRQPLERVKDWLEINQNPNQAHTHLERKRQAARCMDCGTPFCQTHEGCPVNNLIPEFNSLVYADQWKQAYERLMLTNNFPEFTGRVCPAPCEGSCVAGLVDDPVTIKNIEYAIIDRAWNEGWVVPCPPSSRSGFTVAIIGSGPAGLACADQLNKVYGHTVTVFERADRVGGLLTYGIPNPKLDKNTVQRRVDLMVAEGVRFVCNADVGNDPAFDIAEIRKQHHALVLTCGATKSRDLNLPGRELKGIHLAMEMLTKNTAAVQFHNPEVEIIDPKNRNVVVIGGGDTGADCIATSLRHGCKSVINLELLPQPPVARAENNPWPEWPLILRTDYAHAEASALFGSDPRQYSVSTKAFVGGQDGRIKGIKIVNVEWTNVPGDKSHKPRKQMKEVPGTEREVPCDLVVMALGFMGPEAWIASKLPGLQTDERSNVKAPYGNYRTSLDGVFAAGDCRRGQSLVVWAINEGRGAAEAVNTFLGAKADARL
ncbi:hypothetical protein BASA81_002050 [Batrachochytrium salamandrivorans]|nr:hypothetical protein BASA81_002050 [Batrachochytrium salamandrivorans]